MTITEAFEAIKKDETLCARRVGDSSYWYTYVDGSCTTHDKDGPWELVALGSSDVLSDWEVIPISDL